MINILIADNQFLTREGLITVLTGIKDFHISGLASNPAELEEMLLEFKPEVIIIDHNYEHNFSNEDIKKIHARFHDTHILILSNKQQKQEILEAIDLGVKTYVLKECSTDEIINAVYATAKGEVFYCEKTMQTLFGNKLPPKKIDGVPLLSYRETEIVQLIATGLANKEIAEKLYLSIHTIKTHRKNIIKKLGFTFKHASELILLLSYLNDFFI